jgi:4a-hydroxytetrahydrobiopterin dehydratase
MPMSKKEAEALMPELNDWSLIDEGRMIAKGFMFPNFKKTMEFVNKVADIAEEQGHHPDLTVSYGNVGVELMTHAIEGLSENDFILAAKIDELVK